MKKLGVLLLLILPLTGNIIRKVPSKPVEASWTDLICTEQDRSDIHEIVSMVAGKSKLSLLFNQSYLREKGAQINHAHPLKFLSVIFSDPYLRECMNHVWIDHFKKSNFIADLSAALDREIERGKLHLYVPDFAKEVGKPFQEIQSYLDARDWENLLGFLIEPYGS